jgi:hypothetical protein
MLYFRSLKIVQHDIFVVYTCYLVFLVSSIWPISTWVVPVFLLEYCLITLRICCLLFKLSFDVLSVICRLHILRPPFKIPFYLVPPIVFSFRAHTFFNWGPNAAFHGMTLLCHIEGSIHDNRHMNTSADVSKFQKWRIMKLSISITAMKTIWIKTKGQISSKNGDQAFHVLPCQTWTLMKVFSI